MILDFRLQEKSREQFFGCSSVEMVCKPDIVYGFFLSHWERIEVLDIVDVALTLHSPKGRG